MAGEKRKEEEIAEVPDPVSWRLAEWPTTALGTEVSKPNARFL